MCVTCGCGGKKATVEELDQTKTHEHPHAEDGHVHRDSDQHRHHHDAGHHEHDIPTGARVQLELRSFLRPRKKEWKKSTIVWSSWKLTF